jgi:hypothetical protein
MTDLLASMPCRDELCGEVPVSHVQVDGRMTV